MFERNILTKPFIKTRNKYLFKNTLVVKHVKQILCKCIQVFL